MSPRTQARISIRIPLRIRRRTIEYVRAVMDDYDKDKIDEAVLALLHLTAFKDHGVVRSWKGHDWDALDRLHKSGPIGNPKSKAKSVILTDEGRKRSDELFA
jgi:hypothetical protein